MRTAMDPLRQAYRDQATPGGDIADLRREAAARGATVADTPADVLEALLERTGDLDIAADALAMNPRPAWLQDLERDVADAKRPGSI